jgi:Tfp pilus assembly protein PilO
MPKIDLKLLQSKFRFLLFPFIVGAIVIVLTVFFLVPKISQISETRQKLAQEKEKLARLTQKLADLEGLDEVELSTRADLILRALPAEKDVPRILIALSSLSEETEVALTKISVTPGKLSTASAMAEKEPALSFKITASGPMETIKKFLDRLVSTLPVMQISVIKLTEDEAGAGAEVSFDAYFLPLPKSLGEAEKPLAKIVPDEEITYKKIERFRPPSMEEVLPLVGSGKEDLFSF